MFLLPPRIRRLLEGRKDEGSGPRVYASDDDLIASVREVARRERRSEEEVYDDFARAGRDHFARQDNLEARWNSLTPREQEVAALTCLGNRNYEIAGILGIAPETVKTHLQSIFRKFDLRSTKELRLALKHWSFEEWWSARRG
jgi:DNA-binding CsgD family transcriptional regulator